MKIDSNTNIILNEHLKTLLAMINQYFLHARILEDWGFKQLGERNYQFSIRSMKNSDEIIQRILFLEGLPNLQDLGQLFIGEEAIETNKTNLFMEINFRKVLQQGVKNSEESKDYITRDLLTEILEECEERIDFFETQENLLSELGTKNYLQ